MTQNRKELSDNQTPGVRPLSDQQLQDVSGGAIIPWSYIEYKCTRCSYSFSSDVRMEICPECGARLKVVDYYYDEPSLE